MIVVKTNIGEFIKRYQKKVDKFKSVLSTFAEKLAKKMCDDMLDAINRAKSDWNEPQSFLDTLTINESTFNITISGNIAKVTIGENLPLRELGNTEYSIVAKAQKPTYVNPIYFIEFGFGVVGEKKPSPHSKKFDWEYNINRHGRQTEDPWHYRDEMIDLQTSSGKEGINFMYNTIQKYREEWKNYFFELLEEGV
jgi:hypothetical protein